jgi:hypothetical protein
MFTDGGRLGFAPVAMLLAAAACEPPPAVGARSPIVPGEARTFSAIEQEILAPRCATAACHAGDPPAAWPSLDPGAAYDQLVSAPSQQAPALPLVAPYAPAGSYLVLKLRGSAADAGGVATPMPISDAALDEAEIASIEAWIANGAPHD